VCGPPSLDSTTALLLALIHPTEHKMNSRKVGQGFIGNSSPVASVVALINVAGLISPALSLRTETMSRVLMVEDHALYRQVIILLLEMQPDIEVVGGAGSLSEARTMLEGVDVAILDRGLPDGDGLELIDELHEASPGVKVLVINVLEELAKPQEVLEAGADAVLSKLATTDRVLATIRSL